MKVGSGVSPKFNVPVLEQPLANFEDTFAPAGYEPTDTVFCLSGEQQNEALSPV